MAKTFRNLWPELVSWPNLLQAYRRCRRRKRYRQPATAFDFAWEVELLQLQRELTCGDYLPGAYSHFHISANVLLNPIDHYLRETLRIPGYVRYADDLLLFGDTREQLWAAAAALRQRLAEFRLRLHPRKTHVQPASEWLTWLGHVDLVTEQQVIRQLTAQHCVFRRSR